MTSPKKIRHAGVLREDHILPAATNMEKQTNWDRQIAEHQERRALAEKVGIPALNRLIEVARRDTGQSEICGRFLLSLYNGHTFPFNLVDFRNLDQSLWDDCMSVLFLDQRPKKEVHLWIEGGPAIWEELKSSWRTARDRRL